MTTANPSGYYGLQLPEAVEREIEALNLKDLRYLITKIADELYSPYRLGDPELFTSDVLSPNSDEHIDEALDTKALISLMKWLCDRLESLLPTN